MKKDNTLVTVTTADLRKRLKDLLTNITDNIFEVSCIMAELADRGVDVAESRRGVYRWFRKIARGELAPEAAIAFAGSEKLILKMMEFPLEDQRKYARGETIPVAEFIDTGKIQVRDRKLSELNTKQIDLAFGNGAVRPPEVQKRILRSAHVGKTDVRRSASPVTVRADLDTGEIVIGQLRVHAAAVAAALRKLGYRVESETATPKPFKTITKTFEIDPSSLAWLENFRAESAGKEAAS